MYHIERALKYLRAMVGNKARVEGSIAKSFLLKEIKYFLSVYFAEKYNINALTLRYNVDEEPPLSDLKIFQWIGATASSSMTYYYIQEKCCFALHVQQYGRDGSVFHVSVCCISYLSQVPLGFIHLIFDIVNLANRIGGLIVNLQTSS
jgi:hypothetical protein